MWSTLALVAMLITVSDRSAERKPLYELSIPAEWSVEIPSSETDLSDTTLPLLTAKLGDLTLTIHNFPVDSLGERVHPKAQAERWAGQAGEVYETTKIQTGGYWGIQLWRKGVLARAMQLDSELFQNCRSKQMRADYTLKVVGSDEEIEERMDALLTLFESFQLQKELPWRP